MVMRKIHSDTFSFSMNKKAQFFILSAVIIASIIVSLASVKNFVATGDAPKKFYYYSQQLEDETGAVVDYAMYSDPTGNNPSYKNNLNSFLQYGVTKTLQAYPTMEIVACFSNPDDKLKMICQNNGTNVVSITGIRIDNSLENFGSLGGSRTRTILDIGYSGDGTCLFNPESSKYECYIEAEYLGPCLPAQENKACDGTLVTSSTPTEIFGCPTGSTCVNSEISLIDLKALNVTTSTGSYQIPLVGSQVQRGQFYFIFKLNMTSGDYVDTSAGTN
ncbi:MAG: hypothetical protein WCI72_02810 [archaeon]